LRRRWTFHLPYTGQFGAFTSNPIALDGVVYLEDPDSTVFALKQSTGALLWKHAYHSATPSGGPNGMALGYRLLFGETEGAVFALQPKSGKQVWRRRLASNSHAPTTAGRSGRSRSASTTATRPVRYDGTTYALSTKNGSVLWSTKTPAGINSFPAVTRRMLIVGIGARTSAKKPRGEIIAYSLP
jgi:outer membrane protein assembly factor BamB